MNQEQAVRILYKATHDQTVPIEQFMHATKWFCDKYKSTDVEQMRSWSEAWMNNSKIRIPYIHVNYDV